MSKQSKRKRNARFRRANREREKVDKKANRQGIAELRLFSATNGQARVIRPTAETACIGEYNLPMGLKLVGYRAFPDDPNLTLWQLKGARWELVRLFCETFKELGFTWDWADRTAGIVESADYPHGGGFARLTSILLQEEKAYHVN